MGLFDDLNLFLEARLEEFLRNNPQLELQALEEQLREQAAETSRLVTDLQAQEKQLQTEILNTAQEIQRWHTRINKAQTAGRQDLAQAAREREAALLRQGNQRWGQMEALKEQIKQTEALQGQIQVRQQEVQEKVQAETAARSTPKPVEGQTVNGWHHPDSDPNRLEEKFRRWEMDEELEELKRSMGR